MDLYILRHAIAAERDSQRFKHDFDRPLTSQGEQKLRRVLRAMRNLELTFDLILTSPYVRARETAEITAAAFALRNRLETDELLGVDAQPREFIAHLATRAPLPNSVLLVGHEPFLSTLVGLLVCGASRSCCTLKKAGLCKLTVDSLRPGRCAILEWLLTPRQMLLMA